MSDSDASTLLEQAAAFATGLRLQDVPADVVDRAKVTLLHNLTVALAGYRADEPALRLARSGQADDTGARVLVDGARVSLDAAVVPNAAIIHARTQDDAQFSAQTHLGATTLPALLALGDAEGTDGDLLLEAMLVGYEVSTAIGKGPSRAATERGFRPSSILGAFGAAAACGKVLGLGQDEMVSALALCAAFGGGVNQTWASGGGEWQYQVGISARNGLTAALLAQHGVTGAPDALEGESGFYRAFTDPHAAAHNAVHALGLEWTLRDVSYKAHPVCAINQTPVDLAVELRRGGLRAEQVTSLAIHMAPHQAAYPGIDNGGPFRAAGDALMSAQFCLAVALSRGAVRYDDLTAPLTEQERLILPRIAVVPDASLSENHFLLRAETSDGTREAGFDAFEDARPWGEPEAVSFLEAIQPELPIDRAAALRLQAVCLGLEARTARDLVDATLVLV
jgi:2-methylcitrate dehydratase PrpD